MLSILILFGTILYFLYYNFIEKRKKYPAGPLPLPLLGNVLAFPQNNQQDKFIEWSRKFGPVYTIWIGNEPNVVITDYQLLKEALVKQADVFAGRPYNFLFSDFRNGPEYGVIINDGHIWKQQRRFALHVLRDFGVGRQVMEHKIMLETEKLVHSIEKAMTDAHGDPVEIIPCIELAAANIIRDHPSLIVGHTFDGDRESKFREIRKTLDDFFAFGSKLEFFFLAQYPWLRHIPLFDFDPTAEPTDFTLAFLKEMHTGQKAGESLEGFTEKQLTAAIIDMWIAGQETTVTTLSWALLYMMKHPEIQEKCFQEIDEILSTRGDKTLQMTDKNKLPYVSATVTEIQRCSNIVPFNVFHRTTKDTYISGHFIPADSSILPQISAVMYDEKNFTNPSEFDPERYLSEEGKNKSEMVIPFSMGKRSCLGESLARMELFLIFGSLIHKFKFSVSKTGPAPTMEPKMAFTRAPIAYKACIVAR